MFFIDPFFLRKFDTKSISQYFDFKIFGVFLLFFPRVNRSHSCWRKKSFKFNVSLGPRSRRTAASTGAAEGGTGYRCGHNNRPEGAISSRGTPDAGEITRGQLLLSQLIPSRTHVLREPLHRARLKSEVFIGNLIICVIRS